MTLTAQQPHYPIIEALIGRVTHWLKHHNDPGAGELLACGDDLRRIAGEFGMTSNQLIALAKKGPDGADELVKMMRALGLDAAVIAASMPTVMRDLEHSCAMCDNKPECRRDAAAGTLADRYHDYCLNAVTMDALKTAS